MGRLKKSNSTKAHGTEAWASERRCVPIDVHFQSLRQQVTAVRRCGQRKRWVPRRDDGNQRKGEAIQQGSPRQGRTARKKVKSTTNSTCSLARASRRAYFAREVGRAGGAADSGVSGTRGGEGRAGVGWHCQGRGHQRGSQQCFGRYGCHGSQHCGRDVGGQVVWNTEQD